MAYVEVHLVHLVALWPTSLLFYTTGNPGPYLRRMAEAGFSCIHWGHHWNTAFLYSDYEIDQIARWLQEYGLQLNDRHDNDGTGDQHKLPFSGIVDGSRLAQIIAGSAYTKCISLETTIHHTGIEAEPVFLEQAFEAGTTLTGMVEKHR